MIPSVESPDGQQPELPSDLPPVEPPGARFVQLFLIPLLVVAIFVGIYLLFGRIAGSRRDPEAYLADLKSDSHERRWMAARDLAQILPRDRALQNNAEFARKLAAELETQLTKNETAELELNFQQYLAAALGEFNSPAGIPALRQAIESGGNDEVRATAIVSIGSLGVRLGGLPDAGAIGDLVAAGESEDAVIRKLVALSLGATGRTEAIRGLLGLLNDTDREVRYNAASALARLGSSDGLDTLHDMLDLKYLQSLALSPDQLEKVPWSALQALSELLDRSPDTNLDSLRSEIETLSHDGTALVRTRAKELLIKMDGVPSGR